MPRKLLLLSALTCAFAIASPAAFAKDTQKESENFFDITDEIREAGHVVQKGADKTVGFFEGLFDDDKDDDLKFHAPWNTKN